MREAGAMPQWLVGARPGTLEKAGIGAPLALKQATTFCLTQ
jgi:hypothetical protein